VLGQSRTSNQADEFAAEVVDDATWHKPARGSLEVKKRAIAIALFGCLVCSPVHAKTFVGVLWPLFGPLPAIGLVELVAELKKMPEVEVGTYLHQSWPTLVQDIDDQPPGTHIVVVGYSLGANNSVLVANNAKYIDLIVALQPSMLSSDDPPLSSGKVGRMIEVYNPNPWMTFGGMGSKRLVGENIEYIANNDSHPGAQFNSQFHELVKSEIAKFVARDRRETARAETPRRVGVAQVLRSSKVASVEKATHRQGGSTSKDRSKIARAEAPKSLEPTKVEHVADERRTQQLIASTESIDKISSSVDAGDLFVQRQLTVGDLKDYAKRTYSRSPATDLMASASDQAKANR
jgi:hypothetical protein